MEKQLKILVVEDDKYIANFIAVSLEKDGYGLLCAQSADEGLFLFASHHPDIVLLDLGLPDKDGLEVIKAIRDSSDVPIMVVSARGQEKEKIEALDLGANDYITKPFFMGELMARIRVVERGMSTFGMRSNEKTITIGALSVDFEKRRVLVENSEVHLTPIEYRLLKLLLENRGKVLTHNYILKQIWGYENSDTKIVRVYMANLRRKLETGKTGPRYIFTEVGVGYRFSDE